MCNAQENVQDVEYQGGNEAGKAEVIESIAVNSHETEWYAAQILAWQKVVDENPEDQWAWRNLFRAAQYVDMGTDAYASMDENENKEIWVLNRMKKAVPDSFVYHLCMTRLGETSRGHLECAIELLPENAYTDDVSFLAAQSWCYADRVRTVPLPIPFISLKLHKRLFSMTPSISPVPNTSTHNLYNP